MNSLIFRGKWEEIKGHLQKQWGKLTDNEWQEIEGTQHVIYGKLQQHYGLTRSEAEEEVNKFKTKHGF
ncbi:CsbD family protein [Legionella jordanis]|uniref:Stress response protein n=1 Tax=Legionella jordanis TaxID=456 RepID=A0A0W0VGD4_9GAMM|nr:CsbD family protein [Legionella jordanis]KTD19099.1 stress response protein [Legionella jordanis]RMW99305.1 CsbD family protein [Legionella jordanis]VEH12935.1 stress response protein [Legionella jordanis]HAT8715289.1 CsbD family protein [Legionella jordanis]